jgi:hypothetical protein
MEIFFPMKWETKGYATTELIPYESLCKPLANDTIDLISKKGIWNIGSISKKILLNLVRLTKS